MLFCQIMDYRDTRAYILDPCIQEFYIISFYLFLPNAVQMNFILVQARNSYYIFSPFMSFESCKINVCLSNLDNDGFFELKNTFFGQNSTIAHMAWSKQYDCRHNLAKTNRLPTRPS